jgi:hypothetical protein
MSLMVVLVIALVLVVGVVGLWLSDCQPMESDTTTYFARAAIRDIEHEAVQAMRAAERAAQQADTLDGSVVEEGRS